MLTLHLKRCAQCWGTSSRGAKGRWLRPVTDSGLAEGMRVASICMQRIVPTSWCTRKAGSWRIVTGVSRSDVARQLRLNGPDAGKRAQITTPRGRSGCRVAQRIRAPLCNHRGRILHDPILLKPLDGPYLFASAEDVVAPPLGGLATDRRRSGALAETGASGGSIWQRAMSKGLLAGRDGAQALTRAARQGEDGDAGCL